MTPERYLITATPVTPQTRLYATEPLGVRLTVLIAGSTPAVALMNATDATEDGAVRQLSARIVLEFMQGKFCVGPAGLPPGAVHDRVLAALVEAKVKRQSDRDRAIHYLSRLNDEIAAMQAEADERTGTSASVLVGGECDQVEEQALTATKPRAVMPPHREVIEPAQLAVVMAFPPLAQPSVPTQRRDSDITEGLRPLTVPPSPDGLTGDALRDALRRRWHAVAHVGVLGSPDGRLMLWAANHAELAIKMATQDRRWWELGAVGKPTADFIRDAFDRWVVSREGRRVESFEQGTIDKLWDPYCRFMVGDPAARHPVAKTTAPAPSFDDYAEGRRHHDE